MHEGERRLAGERARETDTDTQQSPCEITSKASNYALQYPRKRVTEAPQPPPPSYSGQKIHAGLTSLPLPSPDFRFEKRALNPSWWGHESSANTGDSLLRSSRTHSESSCLSLPLKSIKTSPYLQALSLQDSLATSCCWRISRID